MHDDPGEGQVHPSLQARRLIEALGFDGAQAEAEQAVLRARYFELGELGDYWSSVAVEVLAQRERRH